ncbi:MAG: AMP-binding protein [Cyanobacteria bacterium P01_D01_bin.105]
MFASHSIKNNFRQSGEWFSGDVCLKQGLEQAPTLLEQLYWRAAHQPERIAYRFLFDQPTSVAQSDLAVWTYRDLFLKAQQVAKSLTTAFNGEPAARRVLLVYQPGLELVAAFLGCLMVGAIAVPVPPPGRHESLTRWEQVLADAQVTGVLTTHTLKSELKSLPSASSELASSLKWIITEIGNATVRNTPIEPLPARQTESSSVDFSRQILEQQISRTDVAFLQYTSGSTSQPKGVMVTHGNLAHNLQQIQQAFGHGEHTSCVIWLPPYHDMGLIGGILQPLYGGYPVTLMSPASFLRRPARWLEAISHFDGTTSGGPNFAYDYCLKKTTPEDRKKLNLSAWQVAFTGAEPVQAQTLQKFSEVFSTCGFKASAFYPCYGLAEGTLFVSGGSPNTSPKVATLSRQGLLHNQVEQISLSEETFEETHWEKVSVDERSVDERFTETHLAERRTKNNLEDITAVVSCGQAVNQNIEIVDPKTGRRCKPAEIGEIWLAGQSVAAGYWNRLEATQQTFQASLPGSDELFLRTGDLGFVYQGELFVTGRLKDLMVIRGQNYYPQDIETAIQSAHTGFSSVNAAFGLADEHGEKLAIAQEVTRTAVRLLRKGQLTVEKLKAAIRSKISREFGIQVAEIALLKPGRIPRTTSGKVQRHRCKELLETDEWEAICQASQQSDAKQANAKQSSSQQQPAHSPGSPQEQHKKQRKEQQTVDDLLVWLRQYAHKRLDSRQMDERRCLNPGLVLDFGNKGLLGMQIPEAYGGLGLGNQAMLTIIQQLGAIDLTLALFVGLNNVLGVRPILNYGSAELKDKWLPKLATGRELAAFALTEAVAGSHPIGIAAQAIPTASGWQLQGEKIWSGSAAWAGIINVFVQQLDEDGHPVGMTGFAVEKTAPGLRQGPEALTMGMRGMVQNTVHLEQVPVEAGQRLGEAGAGMPVAQDAMRYGRLAIAAACAGGMKRCAQLMLRYAQRRQISTGRLIENPVMLTRLSWLKNATAMVESLVTLTATRLDQALPVSEDLYAACKILAPELYWQATDALVQSLGGRGYIETNLAPQMMRDARVLRIFEGPTEAIAMHLGARTMAQPAQIEAIFTALEQQEMGQQLAKVTTQLTASIHQVERREPDQRREPDRRERQYELGQAAAWALGTATLKATQSPVSAIKWGEQQLKQQIEQVLQPVQSEVDRLSASQAVEWINGYQSSIGTVDSLAAIAALDEWLTPAPQTDEQTNDQANTQDVRVQFKTRQSTRSTVAQNKIAHTTSRSVAQQKKALTQWMRQWVADQIKTDPVQISSTRTFSEYGLDSVMAVELAEDLSQYLELSTPLEATLVWNFPTISALAAHLAAISHPKDPTLVRQVSKALKLEKEQKHRNQKPKEQRNTEPNVAELDQLSEAELASTLSAELATLRGHITS